MEITAVELDALRKAEVLARLVVEGEGGPVDFGRGWSVTFGREVWDQLLVLFPPVVHHDHDWRWTKVSKAYESNVALIEYICDCRERMHEERDLSPLPNPPEPPHVHLWAATGGLSYRCAEKGCGAEGEVVEVVRDGS